MPRSLLSLGLPIPFLVRSNASVGSKVTIVKYYLDVIEPKIAEPISHNRCQGLGCSLWRKQMKTEILRELASQLVAGDLAVDEFMERLRGAIQVASDTTVDQVTLDLDRQRRCGFPEVVYGEGKLPETVVGIVRRLLVESLPVLVTRVTEEQALVLEQEFPEGIYHASARTFRMHSPPSREQGRVAIVTAGTTDRPVAEEARETLAWMGIPVEFVADVGVAGPHRLREHADMLREMDVVIVVAGLEGALPSVVGGYVDCPVVAVPTSVGYGASFGGVAALLGMLNSCASNVTVVNIDAGFKAAYVAGMIVHVRDPQRHNARSVDDESPCSG